MVLSLLLLLNQCFDMANLYLFLFFNLDVHLDWLNLLIALLYFTYFLVILVDCMFFQSSFKATIRRLIHFAIIKSTTKF